MFSKKFNQPKYHLRSERGFFRNLFKRRKSGVSRGFKLPIFNIINVILIGSVGYFGYYLFLSPKFKIENIAIHGLNFIPPEELLGFVDQNLNDQKFLFFKSRNIFLTSTNKLLAQISSHYLFDSIELKKQLPGSLTFDIVEKNIIYRLRSANYEYLVDDNGQVVKNFMNFTQRPALLQLTGDSVAPADPATGKTDQSQTDLQKDLVSIDPNDHFTLLYLEKDDDVHLGDKVLSADQISFINQLVTEPKGKFYELKLISLPASNPEFLTLVTKDGWKIYFNLRNDLKAQLEALNLVIDQKITPAKIKALDNIDLRLGQNIFYKYR